MAGKRRTRSERKAKSGARRGSGGRAGDRDEGRGGRGGEKRGRGAGARRSGRTPERFVGRILVGRGGARVTPFRDDERRPMDLPSGATRGAHDGDFVVVDPGRGRQAAARVVEVLGRPGHPDADFRAIVLRHRLDVEFPRDVLASLESERPELHESEIAAREDLRALPFLTIDPVNARDHDDAVCVEPLPRGGVRLFVAIADVSARVPEGSALDREALRRGNSVYFPDRAIPMLPPLLSGDLCSLRAGVDRSTVVAVIDFSAEAEPRAKRFTRAIIRSRARLTYEEAAQVMEPGVEPLAGVTAPADTVVREQLTGLATLARRLFARRQADGSIDFDLPTAEIRLDDAGLPVDVVQASRSLSHRAIEEAMLAANRAVAEALTEAGIPILYRIHEPPPPEDLGALEDLLASFGLLEPSADGPLDARAIARAVARAAGRPEERLVNLVALRSMQQARYSESNRGHFALAFPHYTHFTSPIRRYADLVVHRALLDGLLGDAESRERALARGARLARVATRVSALERSSMDAERDMLQLKKCAFLAPHAGRELEGTIAGVARHGLYVTLDPWFVEGLVHISRLPPGLVFDERAHALLPRRGRGGHHLGERLRVRLDSVDPARGWISLSPVRDERVGEVSPARDRGPRPQRRDAPRSDRAHRRRPSR